MADRAERLLFDLGRRVAELRAKRELTQEELAEALDVTPRHVQSIEAGRQNMSVRALLRLADALDVHVRELFKAPKQRMVRIGRPRRKR